MDCTLCSLPFGMQGKEERLKIQQQKVICDFGEAGKTATSSKIRSLERGVVHGSWSLVE